MNIGTMRATHVTATCCRVPGTFRSRDFHYITWNLRTPFRPCYCVLLLYGCCMQHRSVLYLTHIRYRSAQAADSLRLPRCEAVALTEARLRLLGEERRALPKRRAGSSEATCRHDKADRATDDTAERQGCERDGPRAEHDSSCNIPPPTVYVEL